MIPDDALLDLTAHTLFERYRESLSLVWLAGRHLSPRPIIPNDGDKNRRFVGSHADNPLPQVIVFSERDASHEVHNELLRKLRSGGVRLLIFSNEAEISADVLSIVQKCSVPILTSQATGQAIVDRLNQDLASHFSCKVTLHGVFLDVLGMGVFLRGASGIGKSELALGLVNCGHRLVADDAVIFSRTPGNIILGHCPPSLQDFLEVRGLGIINIRAMFGDNAIKESKRLHLIIEVVAFKEQELCQLDRLEGKHSLQEILSVPIPKVMIPVTPGRNLAVLVEAAVRDQILRLTGYKASEEFLARHKLSIEQETL